jgi:hypothetical protein
VIPEYELAWLFKIARNVCYNRTESSSRRRRVESDLDTLEEVVATPERSVSLSVGELTRALGEIPERQRRALVLREFQGMSYEEITGELGVSVAAVETLLFRARRSLADQLEQTGTPRRRGAVASVVALFRWFFDGSAVPVKLAAVTAAIGTTTTLAIAPTIGSKRGEPVQTIPRCRHAGCPHGDACAGRDRQSGEARRAGPRIADRADDVADSDGGEPDGA